MSIDFSTLQGLTIPEGVVTQITDASGRVLWKSRPVIKDYLTFSSDNPFSLSVAARGWDGVIYYSLNAKDWIEWNGSTISANTIYLCGEGNTKITGSSLNKYVWVFNGSGISCNGNIDTLLDYKTVASGGHPTLANSCYEKMFYNCTSLITAPALPATTLAYRCYSSMFYNCTNLITAPALPATTLADYCYSSLFQGCTNLITAPALPATTLAESCYVSMFSYCANLTTAPALPATTLAYSCYNLMFSYCTNLTTAPALPATTLANCCYTGMFSGCTSLITAPALPATTLANNCYETMFCECTSLTTAPALPATTLANKCYYCMFYICTNLVTVPKLPATTLAESCYDSMFDSCTKLKLSKTKNTNYTKAYRIPTSGTGTEADFSLFGMFASTGGTFTGEPSINTTYYLHKSNSIV